ncbi:VOC family protein [Candidatus Woesebacteria bacterium]|nr:VOC family protein [Candidatus Woesebacteria bacterium]MCD8507485.1 VOC family protein [Candidatus Woesebacteria bacterium]MCD8526940.1 VOC family protein [Candidatus Woesebacteria bacterium]MCD8545839.1 VOC family protein [Candidatus Woesebacteria bacterium]
MTPHISIITLGVKDVAASTEFYEKLGFPVEPSGKITFITTSPTSKLALYGLQDLAQDAGVEAQTGSFSGITLAHNVVSKEQVDAVIEEARNIGARITDEPHEREWGGYSGYFQDPDGYLWEIGFNPFDPEIAVDEGKPREKQSSTDPNS